MESWDSLGLDGEVVNEFVNEAMCGLDSLRTCLMHFDSQPEENLNAVYRWVHTVKGTAGFLNLKSLQTFAHTYENFLQKIQARDAKPQADEIVKIEEGVDLLQDALEKLLDKEVQLVEDCKHFLDQLTEGEQIDSSESMSKVVERLNSLIGICNQTQSDKDVKLPDVIIKALATLENFFEEKNEFFEVELTKTALMLQSVVDTEGKDWSKSVLMVLSGLEELMITGGNLTPERSKMIEEVTLEMHQFLYPDVEEKIFNWDTTATLARLMPEVFEQFWTNFWRKSIEPHFDIKFADIDEFSSKMLGIEIKQDKSNTKPVVESIPVTESNVQETVRVDAAHFNSFTKDTDKLIGHTNYLETLTRQARKSLPPQMAHDMREGMHQLQQTIGSFQEALVSIRATRMTELFERLPRMIRKLEKDLGRKVILDIQGEALEVDRSVIHVLADPIVHLVRNALDHGLETPEERIANGKSESGTLLVEASKDNEWLILKIKDDGHGINAEKVLAKAVEKGVVDENSKLSNEEIFQLILIPGFSMAKKVSAVSGRGVGMDVVMNTLSSHGGSLQIESELNKGSAFILKFPLEDNLLSRQLILIQHGAIVYAVRQEIMREVVEVENNDWWLDEKENIFYHQTQESHFVSLDNLWNDAPVKEIKTGKILVLEDSSNQRIAFHIDRVLRSLRATIKPFQNDFLLSLQWFEGSIVTGREPPIPVLSSENLNVFL